jgi:hypothetical protein
MKVNAVVGHLVLPHRVPEVSACWYECVEFPPRGIKSIKGLLLQFAGLWEDDLRGKLVPVVGTVKFGRQTFLQDERRRITGKLTTDSATAKPIGGLITRQSPVSQRRQRGGNFYLQRTKQKLPAAMTRK